MSGMPSASRSGVAALAVVLAFANCSFAEANPSPSLAQRTGVVAAADPAAEWSREALVSILELERRTADAIARRSDSDLILVGQAAGNLLAGGGLHEPCAVALNSIMIVAQVLGNPTSTVEDKRAWSASPSGWAVDQVATPISDCEDRTGVPHSVRVLTPKLIQSYSQRR